MDIPPLYVGLVVGAALFAASCPLTLWLALPTYQGESLGGWLSGEATRGRAVVVVTCCLLGSTVFATWLALSFRFDTIYMIG